MRGAALAVRSVVAWGVVGLGAGCGLLVAFGVPWVKALLGTVGLLLILLVAYGLEQAGLLRPPQPDVPQRRPGVPPSQSDLPQRRPDPPPSQSDLPQRRPDPPPSSPDLPQRRPEPPPWSSPGPPREPPPP